MTEAVPDGADVIYDLERLIPGMDTTVQCPVFKYTEWVRDRELRLQMFFSRCSGRFETITNTIMHLNDHHDWSREQIADWLDTLDVDLTIGEPVKAAPPHRQLSITDEVHEFQAKSAVVQAAVLADVSAEQWKSFAAQVYNLSQKYASVGDEMKTAAKSFHVNINTMFSGAMEVSIGNSVNHPVNYLLEDALAKKREQQEAQSKGLAKVQALHDPTKKKGIK